MRDVIQVEHGCRTHDVHFHLGSFLLLLLLLAPGGPLPTLLLAACILCLGLASLAGLQQKAGNLVFFPIK